MSESQKEERGGRREEEGSGMVRGNQEGKESREKGGEKTTQQMSGKNRRKSDMQGQAKVDITCGRCQKRGAKSNNNFRLIKVFQNKKGDDLSQKQGSKSQRGKEGAIGMEVFVWVQGVRTIRGGAWA